MAVKNAKKKGAKHRSVRRRTTAVSVVAAEEPEPTAPVQEPTTDEEEGSVGSGEEEDKEETDDFGIVQEREKDELEIANAQKRYSTQESHRFSKSLIAQSHGFVREKLFRVMKFPDDAQLYKFKNEIRKTLLTGLHADDKDSRMLFDSVVFPELVRSYKITFRGRRRSIHQAMEKIAIGEHRGFSLFLHKVIVHLTFLASYYHGGRC
jgi:hypothetical protein